jgi:hypothetical protein
MVKARRKVLIIGIVDSVHLGRWLKQFSAKEIDFYIFASKKYRRLHKITISLSKQSKPAKFKISSPIKSKFLAGYIDFFYFEFLGKFLPKFKRSFFLTCLLKREKFDYIHAIEIQGAGYLLDLIDYNLIEDQAIIITNWGSDIFYFRKFADDALRIRSVLSKADFYSAECQRDYALAREFGFTGIELPCIPNAGGFELIGNTLNKIPTSLRKTILIKGYGGTFGGARLVIPVLPKILATYPEFRVHVYSVTDDILKMIKKLPAEVQLKIKITTNRKRVSHPKMLSEFANSRIHIGCSESDGISTAFLESLVMGVYPIQTNTSCAIEYVNLGAVASIVRLNKNEILDQIYLALKNDSLVDRAAEQNYKVAQKYLDYKVVQNKALQFYK